MDQDFVIENVATYLEGSYLFFGIVSRQVNSLMFNKETSIENATMTRKCLEESIKTDPSVWYSIFYHIADRIHEYGLDRDAITWLYELYLTHSKSIIDDEKHLGDMLFYLGESGAIEWIQLWFLLNKFSDMISSDEWFMAMLGTITTGCLKDIRWYFYRTGIKWELEEVRTSYSMAFHSVLHTECFKFISGEECCKHDVGVIEEFVRIGSQDMVEWAEDNGYT